MKRRNLIMVVSMVFVFGLLLSGCGLLGPAATPTTNPADMQATVDAIVRDTMQANSAMLTSTAAVMPTNTTAPTETTAPTNTPEPTATIFIPTATNTYIPPTPKPTLTFTPAPFACKLTSTSPAAGTKIKINTDFDAVWKVTNIGTKVWEVGYTDLKYISGTKMQTVADIFDLNTAVAAGGELTLIVDMKTPGTAGKYTAQWALTMDGTVLCTLPVDIEAVNP